MKELDPSSQRLHRRRKSSKQGKCTKKGNLALTTRTRKFKKLSPQKKKGKKPQGKHIDVSKVDCYNCYKIGHFVKDWRQPKRKFKRRFQASAAEEEEEEEEEPKKKKNTKATKEDEPRKEYYLIFVLFGSIIDSANSWLVDSGASKHMTGNRGVLTIYRMKKFTTQVDLGDDSTYKIEGVGSTSLQLDLGTVLHINDILYVPRLNKNLQPVTILEDKGYKVLFMDKKVLLCENKLVRASNRKLTDLGEFRASHPPSSQQ